MEQYNGVRVEAEQTAALLRAALRRVGLPEHEATRVRAVVNSKGRAYVDIGALPLGSTVKLLNALPLALESSG
ncbi:hypothetical protein AB0L85_21790 [Streptomyces sp. NPDC052051]|uniref:hypothetical protein n=1 Tax=Streptomyces sp. NPDC052051 TaxID=3154649 RepID=UPI00342D701E